jgi:predicted AlkP superfamily pyrophosphatase or phosphodiesterase
MTKVILCLLDAMRDDVARRYMGYLEGLVEHRVATRYSVRGELPSMSRPMYETIHTGVPAYVHGITSNNINRRSRMPNIFEIARTQGLVTAASAYSWFSELYNRSPYDVVDDREVNDNTLNIQHGRFYSEDSYPDVEVFAAGAMLARRYYPDYLLIHPSHQDYVGEEFGGDSPQYRRNAIIQDQIIANLVPEAVEVGQYTVLVTADHGMADDPSTHGGTTPQQRNVPLYVIQPGGTGKGDTGQIVSQLQIAPTILHLLNLPIPPTMKAVPLSLH